MAALPTIALPACQPHHERAAFNMNKFLLSTLLVATLGIAGCGGSAGNEQKLADQVTKAVYNNDMGGVTANMDSEAAQQVTRASLGAVSDLMHRMGNYQGLTETGTDIPTHRYTFDAKFDHGDLTIKLRLDADGKIAGYHVIPGPPA